MKQEIEWHRKNGYVKHLPCKTALCPACGSGEVYQPGQSMDMPMNWVCLTCNHRAASTAFEKL